MVGECRLCFQNTMEWVGPLYENRYTETNMDNLLIQEILSITSPKYKIFDLILCEHLSGVIKILNIIEKPYTKMDYALTAGVEFIII